MSDVRVWNKSYDLFIHNHVNNTIHVIVKVNYYQSLKTVFWGFETKFLL